MTMRRALFFPLVASAKARMPYSILSFAADHQDARLAIGAGWNG
jgi:hypothetical protein